MALEELSASISREINKLFSFPDPLYGELIWSVLLFIGFIIVGWGITHVFKHYFMKWAKKTKTKIDDEILKNVKKPIYVLVIFLGVYYFITNLSIVEQYSETLSVIFILIEGFIVAFITTRVVNVIIA